MALYKIHNLRNTKFGDIFPQHKLFPKKQYPPRDAVLRGVPKAPQAQHWNRAPFKFTPGPKVNGGFKAPVRSNNYRHGLSPTKVWEYFPIFARTGRYIAFYYNYHIFHHDVSYCNGYYTFTKEGGFSWHSMLGFPEGGIYSHHGLGGNLGSHWRYILAPKYPIPFKPIQPPYWPQRFEFPPAWSAAQEYGDRFIGLSAGLEGWCYGGVTEDWRQGYEAWGTSQYGPAKFNPTIPITGTRSVPA